MQTGSFGITTGILTLIGSNLIQQGHDLAILLGTALCLGGLVSVGLFGKK